MIYLFHGTDDYRVRQAVREVRERLRAADEMLDTNTSTLDGRELTANELLAHATAVPFLAPRRLVIVEGLIAALAEIRAGRRGKKAAADDPLDPWRRAAQALSDATMPETTTLVFVEGEIARNNAAFTVFAPIAKTVEFALLRKDELPSWIEQRARERGVRLAPRSIAALAQTVGPNLWMMDNELEKLAVYAGGEVVEPETVATIVSVAQETRIWDLTDAVVAGDERKALGAMRALLADGEAPQWILFMIARQFRQLVLVKDLRERGVRAEEVARSAGVPSFRLSAVGAIASRYSWNALRAMYSRMLEADLNVKRGLSDDEPSLQLLIHDLCAKAPAAAVHRR